MRFTITHRILHWSMGLLMVVLFCTGFLRMNWMGRKQITGIIEQHAPGLMTREQMGTIVKDILRPMWQWHEYAAYAIVVVFSVRVVYMLVKGIRFPNCFARDLSIKERLQGTSYVLFYLFVAISTITGFYLKWIEGSWKEHLEALHKLAIYWFPVFMLIHIGGVVISELKGKKGIASRMIGG
ncbi:MAG: cytochrome b/b6 domain-containing protein [Arcticibacter sp.]